MNGGRHRQGERDPPAARRARVTRRGGLFPRHHRFAHRGAIPAIRRQEVGKDGLGVVTPGAAHTQYEETLGMVPVVPGRPVARLMPPVETVAGRTAFGEEYGIPPVVECRQILLHGPPHKCYNNDV